MKQDARVLIVDDDREMAEALAISLSENRYQCEVALNGAAALQAIHDHPFDVVVSDIVMDGMSGFELLDRLRKTQPSLPVVMLTGRSQLAGAVDATKRGAFQYLAKPCDASTLQGVLAQALEERGSVRARSQAPSSPPAVTGPLREMLGATPAMAALRERIDRVAVSSAPVLVLGESGVGKELVAHAIHARGPRSHRPFLAVNVAAIPEQLLESEIFGHVRGAFTGANGARHGLLLEAEGGTLLLDEIGDMPLGLQAKLLRVLQFHELRAVGADRVRTVDVRIIAATHRDLPAFIQAGRMREDLYHRLNVLPIVVPPLRERRGDIPELASHFLALARQHMPTSVVRTISPEALELLSCAEWPGNVRQLASVIERLVVFGREETIEPHDLQLRSAEIPEHRSPDLPPASGTLKEVSAHHVARVLAQTGGNKMRAADILGINLSTLYRWERPKRAG